MSLLKFLRNDPKELSSEEKEKHGGETMSPHEEPSSKYEENYKELFGDDGQSDSYDAMLKKAQRDLAEEKMHSERERPSYDTPAEASLFSDDENPPAVQTPAKRAMIRWHDNKNKEGNGFYECVDIDTGEIVTSAPTFQIAQRRLRKKRYTDIYSQLHNSLKSLGKNELAEKLEAGQRLYTKNPYAEQFCLKMGKGFRIMYCKTPQKATEWALAEYYHELNEQKGIDS